MKSKTEVNRSIPDWLHDVLLGHGDVSSASYNSARIREYASTTVGVTNPDDALDYGDTFVSIEHLHESYQGYEIHMKQDENCESEYCHSISTNIISLALMLISPCSFSQIEDKLQNSYQRQLN